MSYIVLWFLDWLYLKQGIPDIVTFHDTSGNTSIIIQSKDINISVVRKLLYVLHVTL